MDKTRYKTGIDVTFFGNKHSEISLGYWWNDEKYVYISFFFIEVAIGKVRTIK